MPDLAWRDPSAKRIYAIKVVIVDEDEDQVYTYQAVNAEKLREICDKHSMNFDDAAYVVNERVKSLGSTMFMFRLPIFNQYHPKEN